MKRDVRLAFARLIQSNVVENYLFAETAPLKIGELTSDFLHFFGFGSGHHGGHKIHKELEDYTLLLFPVEDNYIRDSSLVQQLFDKLAHEFYFEPIDIQKAFLFMAAAHGKNFTKNLGNINSYGSDVLPHVHPLFSYGANEYGSRFFSIGFGGTILNHPIIQEFLEVSGIKTYPIADFPYFSWDCWTGISTELHARGMFGAMKQTHFMSSTHKDQLRSIATIEAEAMRIINVG